MSPFLAGTREGSPSDGDFERLQTLAFTATGGDVWHLARVEKVAKQYVDDGVRGDTFFEELADFITRTWPAKKGTPI